MKFLNKINVNFWRFYRLCFLFFSNFFSVFLSKVPYRCFVHSTKDCGRIFSLHCLHWGKFSSTHFFTFLAVNGNLLFVFFLRQYLVSQNFPLKYKQNIIRWWKIKQRKHTFNCTSRYPYQNKTKKLCIPLAISWLPLVVFILSLADCVFNLIKKL